IRALSAIKGFFQRDLDGLIDVGSFAGCGAHALPPARGSPEQLLEETAEVLRLEVEAGRAGAAVGRGARPGVAGARPAPKVRACCLRLLDLLPVMTPTVVLPAFIRI